MPAAWPVQTDVQRVLTNAGITLNLAGSDLSTRFAEVVAEVVAEVGVLTYRQWIADTVDATRYFGGSGTPELEVDEMVSLTSVALILSPLDLNGTPYPYASLVPEIGRPFTRIVVSQGAAWQMYPQFFPRGRENVKVTGKWGYGASIPDDLWSAVRGEMAWRLAGEPLFLKGRISSRQVDSVRVGYEHIAGGWHPGYLQAIARYKRPLSRQLRLWRKRLI